MRHHYLRMKIKVFVWEPSINKYCQGIKRTSYATLRKVYQFKLGLSHSHKPNMDESTLNTLLGVVGF